MDKLKEIVPRLPGKGKENPFRVPEGYFEAFPQRLEDRIQSQAKAPVRDHRILVLKPYLAAAIILVVAIVSATLIFRDPDAQVGLPDLQTEISQVVEWELYSISEEDIFDAMYDEGMWEETDVHQTSDEIIDYLMNEDIPMDVLLDAM